MGHSVIIWRITSTFTDTAPGSGGPFILVAGNYIHSILEDSTNTLTAKYSSTTADNTGFEITGGPSLFSDPTGTVELVSVAPHYQYCEGSTLHRVGTSNGWPYATLSNNPNSSECVISNVCDLEISSDYAITPASAPGAYDGAIVGTASSSNGLIKFSRDPNFPYGSSNPGGTMTPISGWEISTTSSDPVIWTTGAEPYVTLTPVTTGPTLSDILRMPYSTVWVAGQLYTFNYSFRATSQNSDFRYIYMRAYDDMMNVLAEKIAYGWGSPTGAEGSTFQGQWAMVAPVGMRYIGIMVSYSSTLGVSGSDETRVLQFEEVVTADAPGVQTELNFTGLAEGTYTIYAKDEAGCQDSITFVVPVTEVYNVRYRLDFKDFMSLSHRWHRVDIYERSYTGDIELIKSGDTPLVIRYEGDADDASKPLIPSNMQVQLRCHTNEQFQSVFLSDDRKYLVKHYVDNNRNFTSAQFYWTGYVVPEFYSEPYTAPPFDVTVTVSDQIGELKNLDFLNEADKKFKGEMSIIKILAAVFKTTGLDLPIRSGVNVWADLMNQEDDPLLQAFLDMRIFEKQKCSYVLEEIAKAFRGQIFQSMGYWWFIRLSDATGTFAYREYDKDGNQIGSGTFASIKEIGYPRIFRTTGGLFADRRQLRSSLRNYGKFSITQNLGKDGNIIDEGRFEDDDIELQSSGNVGFKRWTFSIGQPGVTYGIEKVDNGDSKGAFFADFTKVPGNTVESDCVLASDVLPLDIFGGKIRFKFQYMVSPAYKAPYIRVAWALKIVTTGGDDWWFGQSGAGAWTIFPEETRNEIYVTSYDSWQSFDLLLDWPTIATWRSIQISFYFHNHSLRDFADVDELKAVASPAPGLMKMVRNDPEPESWVYKSEYSYDAEDSPVVVRPVDYDEGDADHRVLWRRESIFGPLASGIGLLNRIKFDNVSIAIYPAEPTDAVIIDPPETLTYTQTENRAIKSVMEQDVVIGDMLRIDPETDHYRNERYIYRSFFRLSDGTPTQYWHRLDVDESKPLLRITLEDYIAQFSAPQKKLSGPIISSQVIHFINSIRDNVDLKRYRPMTFVFDAKKAEYTIDMSAVNGGPDGEPPLVLGAYDHNFSDAYNGGIANGEITIGGYSDAFNPDFE